MLLVTFAFLNVLGFGVWLLGHYFDYTGVAAIGAVFIIAAGAAVTLTTLEVRDGEHIERDFATVDNDTVNNQTIVHETTRTVKISDQFGGPLNNFSIGGLMMLVGGLLMTQHLNEV